MKHNMDRQRWPEPPHAQAVQNCIYPMNAKFGQAQVGKTVTLETYNFGKVQFWKQLLL